MKTLFAIVAVLLVASTVSAQDKSVMRPIQIGPSFSLNLTRNTVDYKVSGPERSWGLGSRFGVMGDIPVGTDMAVVAGLDYYTLSFSDINKGIDITAPGAEDKDQLLPVGTLMTTEGSFNYLALTAMFRVSSFCIGFTFGLPLTATIKNSFDPSYSLPKTFRINDNEEFLLKEDISPPSSERAFLIEGRIAGDFVIIENESGGLHLILSAAYPFSQMISSASGDDRVQDLGNGQTKVTKVTNLPHLNDNFRLPTLSLGLSYLFGL